MTSAVPRLSPALSGRVWGSHAAPLSCAVCWGHSPTHEAGAHQSSFPSCQFYFFPFLLGFYLRFLMAPGAKPSMGAPMAISTSVGINTLLTDVGPGAKQDLEGSWKHSVKEGWI